MLMNSQVAAKEIQQWRVLFLRNTFFCKYVILIRHVLVVIASEIAMDTTCTTKTNICLPFLSVIILNP